MRRRPHLRAFTLLELIVVIAIIGVLSVIIMPSFTNALARSRDAERKLDYSNIYKALQQYQVLYGGLPSTASYGQSDAGAWDYSSQGGGFLTFLVTSKVLTKVPVDPVNNMTGDNSPAGSYSYKYYCYPGVGMTFLVSKLETETGTLGIVQEPGWTCL